MAGNDECEHGYVAWSCTACADARDQADQEGRQEEITRLTRERDEARAEVERLRAEVGDAARRVMEAAALVESARKERDEWRDQAANHAQRSEESRVYAEEQRGRATKAEEECMEASAKIASLTEQLDALRGAPCARLRWEQERDEARAEVERLRAGLRSLMGASRAAAGPIIRCLLNFEPLPEHERLANIDREADRD